MSNNLRRWVRRYFCFLPSSLSPSARRERTKCLARRGNFFASRGVRLHSPSWNRKLNNNFRFSLFTFWLNQRCFSLPPGKLRPRQARLTFNPISDFQSLHFRFSSDVLHTSLQQRQLEQLKLLASLWCLPRRLFQFALRCRSTRMCRTKEGNPPKCNYISISQPNLRAEQGSHPSRASTREQITFRVAQLHIFLIPRSPNAADVEMNSIFHGQFTLQSLRSRSCFAFSLFTVRFDFDCNSISFSFPSRRTRGEEKEEKNRKVTAR